MQTKLNSLLHSGVLEMGALTLALMAYGSCIGVYGEPHRTPLDSIHAGDNAGLRHQLKNGANPNDKDGAGTPLLMSGALYGDAEAVRLLLDNGADPNATNPLGATALIWAAGDPEKVALMVSHGADVNAQSKLGRTALLAAAGLDGAGPSVRMLVQHGANLDVKDGLKGEPKLPIGGGGAPPIVEAAKARDGEALRLLLAKPGIDLDAVDNTGATALTQAVVLSHCANARLLLKAGANPNVVFSSSKYTPLMWAAMRNDPELIQMLVDAGANVNAQDTFGSSALILAAGVAETGNPQVADLLIKAGADVNIRNRRGETALTVALWHGTTPLVGYLKQAGTPQ